MELRELKYFLAVAEEQSITRAAERLYITQPSLSKQMQNLEREAGRQLLVRGKRRVTLTDAGRLLKKRAQELLELYEKTQTELCSPLGEVRGEVTIGGGESYAVQTVARAATKLQCDYPAVQFNFFSGDADDISDKLEKGLVDFAIFVDTKDISRYESLRLPQTDTWGVLMRKDDPLAQRKEVTREELRARPLVLSAQSQHSGSALRKWMGSDAPAPKATYNLIYNASLLVREGMGCAPTLAKLVNTACDSDLTFRPLSPALETPLDIVWKKYVPFSQAAELFLQYLRREIAAENGERAEENGGTKNSEAADAAPQNGTADGCRQAETAI